MQIYSFYSKYHKAILIAIVAVAFLTGLLLPSPFQNSSDIVQHLNDTIIFTVDTTGMVMADGSVYEGSINSKTKAPHGFGVLKKKVTSYEGNWEDGKLQFGKRTTDLAVYEGEFDDDLNSDGFGITNYNEKYIRSKRNQGVEEDDITVTYIGNWKGNAKDGLGRSIKADASMEFGHYKDGIFQPVDGANYRIGGSVYGIDLSHYQKNLDWSQLALYCDRNGNVFSGTPIEKKYMQPVLFAYIKATEGSTVKDETYDEKAIAAERHGITKGAYHFLRLGSDVNEQIKNFLQTANWTDGDLPPALDVELESEIQTHGADKLLDVTFTWLEAVEAELGVRPIIYTRESIRDKYLIKDPRFKNYKCWIARYHPDGPNNKEWKMWQMTETAHMNGHDGNVDVNLYKDDYNAFKDYLESLSTRKYASTNLSLDSINAKSVD